MFFFWGGGYLSSSRQVDQLLKGAVYDGTAYYFEIVTASRGAPKRLDESPIGNAALRYPGLCQTLGVGELVKTRTHRILTQLIIVIILLYSHKTWVGTRQNKNPSHFDSIDYLYYIIIFS